MAIRQGFGPSERMSTSEADDQYPPEEAQRRFEALIRAARRLPLHRKDMPRLRSESKRRAGTTAEPPESASGALD